MEKLLTSSGEFLGYKGELEKLEEIIIGVRQTLDFKISEEIFKDYNEIKFHNSSDENINFNLCFNKILLIINKLNIQLVDQNTMVYFYRFKSFISSNLTEKERDNASEKVLNIIYL